MDIWVTVQDCIDLPCVPKTTAGVIHRAKIERWQFRKKRFGKGFEYNIDCLPPQARAAYFKKNNKILVNNILLDAPKPKQERYSAEAVWFNWEQSTDKQKEKAKFKVEVVIAAKAMIDSGVDVLTAFDAVAQSHDCNSSKVKRWVYQVKGYEPTDYLPALLDKHKNRDFSHRKAEMTPIAWDFFVGDYFRLERPALRSCYQRLTEAAKEHGWKIPSLTALRRKIEADVPIEQQTLWRKGEHALMQLYPAQQRTVADLSAMEWINGDGYLHNVFVKWYNGEIKRPKTWIWQDIRTRKILAYRVDVSENTDVIRLSLSDLITHYGIPKHITIDNTRAAANKQLTAGVANRYRFLVKKDDPIGIIPMLGIKLHWSSVLYGKGHGQAKPVERAFSHGGLGELVDKHPSLAGAYTGANVLDKPDNYNSDNAVDINVFMTALKDGIDAYNRKPNRNTEVCQGLMSFDDAFNASYQSSVIRKATKEQQRLLLLPTEAVTVKFDGTFTLKAGGSIQGCENRYFNEKLIGIKPNKVAIRFDPQNLHQSVLVYTLGGLLICEAVCIERVAFGDTRAAREHKRERTQFVKNNKKLAKNLKHMNALEVAALMPNIDAPEVSEPKIISVNLVNENKKPNPDIVDFNFEEAFTKGMEKLANER